MKPSSFGGSSAKKDIILGTDAGKYDIARTTE